MHRSIHPFPARMAPELAIKSLNSIPSQALVLDPMSGSGTVVRHASELGIRSIGFDLDPLAVMVSGVASRRNDEPAIRSYAKKFLNEVNALKSAPALEWIDGDPDAERFISYWFGGKQRDDLRKIAYILNSSDKFDIPDPIAEVLRISLSRIIITKKQAASLAQDTSHSRPHRVAIESDYDVLDGFRKSLDQLLRRLAKIEPKVEARVARGDARELASVGDETIDYVLTSPPYLNAIDYMRGHRMSLIWLGYKYAELSSTRSNSIGSERKPDAPVPRDVRQTVMESMGDIGALQSRQRNMIERYIGDLHKMMSQTYRVLRVGGSATFVMGDSRLNGVFVSNSNGLAAVAKLVGMGEVRRFERQLPIQHRYLPTPDDGALGKRMRKETILTFQK